MAMNIAEEKPWVQEAQAELVDGLKARSEAAWTALYDDNYQALFRYAVARTSNVTVAQDIAADVFSEAVKGIGSYEARGKPILAWLYRIARNLVADHFTALRRKGGQPLSDIESSGGLDMADPGADPALHVQRLDVRNALGVIKDSHREVIILHYYLGLTLPETASLLGRKERAVYSLHERAIEALRRQFQETSRATE
jgi:RNA polymerase sigma-70 factor (ECF subfamily)